ncbi:MAG: hypothetical protein LBR80_06435 [Deltaproteobacteria bacterium]|nr:hypothetical protein [Deltaproteobacteria bacterium]
MQFLECCGPSGIGVEGSQIFRVTVARGGLAASVAGDRMGSVKRRR